MRPRFYVRLFSKSPTPPPPFLHADARCTAGILGRIVQAIYAVRIASNRLVESVVLEGLLDKWYIELPNHLRFEPGLSKRPVPPPHILTLHMQYWCAVLLLHRPL